MKNRIIAIALICAIALTSFTGCGKKKVGDISVVAGESAIFIAKNGKISYAIAENFDKDYYDKKILKDSIKNELKEFNKENHSAKLKSFWIENEIVTAILKYSSEKEFVEYIHDCNGVEEFFIGNISDAMSDGFEIVGEFTKIEDGSLTQDTALSNEIKEMDCKIIILNSYAKIQLEKGDVKYISSNCSVDNGIITVSADHCSTGDGIAELSYIVYE